MEILSKINNFFNRTSAKNAALPPVTFDLMASDISIFERFGLSQSRGVPVKDGEAYLAYRRHELVYACINKIADVMGDAEIVVERRRRDGEWESVAGHALTALFRRPNGEQTGRDLRRLLIQSEQCTGLFYVYVNRSGAGIPAEIQVLHPSRVNPRKDSNGKLLYYEYLATGGRTIRLKVEDVWCRRRPDLLDQAFGFPPVKVALRSINSDIGMTDYVDAFFDSDGTPSGILSVKHALNDVQKERMKEEWRDRYGRFGRDHKGVAVLDADLDYQRIGSNLNELASEELSGRFESRICSVFGVPPNLVGAYVGLQHVTANASAKADLRNFWDNKISPELASLREWLTWFILPEFEPLDQIKADRIRVGFDISQVAFLQDDVDGIHDRARKNLQAGGWTVNEFREATGQKVDPDGDYYIQPSSVVPVSPENRSLAAFEKVEQGKEPSDGENDATGDANGQSEAADDEDEPDKRNIDDAKRRPVLTLVKKKSKSVAFDGLTLHREPTEIEKAIGLKTIVEEHKTLSAALSATLSRFRTSLIDQAVTNLDGVSTAEAAEMQLIPDLKAKKSVANVIKKAYRQGVLQIERELSSGKKDDDRGDIEDELDEITDLVISKMVSEVRSRAINGYVMLKLLLDYTVEKLRTLLKGESEKFLEQLAANTVNAAINRGRTDEGKRRSGEWKRVYYSAILDSGTCEACEEADGLEADDAADLPSVPNPECAGGANCRCMHIYVAGTEVE